MSEPLIIKIRGKISTFAAYGGYGRGGITGHLIMKDGRGFIFPAEKFAAYHGARIEFELPSREANVAWRFVNTPQSKETIVANYP